MEVVDWALGRRVHGRNDRCVVCLTAHALRKCRAHHNTSTGIPCGCAEDRSLCMLDVELVSIYNEQPSISHLLPISTTAEQPGTMYDAITWSTWLILCTSPSLAASQLLCSLVVQCQQPQPQQPVLPLLTLLLGICVAAVACAAANCSFRRWCVPGSPRGVWSGCKRKYSSGRCLGHTPVTAAATTLK